MAINFVEHKNSCTKCFKFTNLTYLCNFNRIIYLRFDINDVNKQIIKL